MSNDITALKFSPDGTVERIALPKDSAAQLRELQGITGGYIQGVYGWTGDPDTTRSDVTFFVDEEGKLKNLPINTKATALWWTLDRTMVNIDYLCGVVVVTGGADSRGDTVSVPSEVVAEVERVEGI